MQTLKIHGGCLDKVVRRILGEGFHARDSSTFLRGDINHSNRYPCSSGITALQAVVGHPPLWTFTVLSGYPARYLISSTPSFLFPASKSKAEFLPSLRRTTWTFLRSLGPAVTLSPNLIETYQAKTMFLPRRNSVPITLEKDEVVSKDCLQRKPQGQITRQLNRTSTSGSQRA